MLKIEVHFATRITLTQTLNIKPFSPQNFEGRNGARPDYNPTLEVLRQWEQRFTHGPPLRELINVLKEMERLDTIGVIDDMLDSKCNVFLLLHSLFTQLNFISIQDSDITMSCPDHYTKLFAPY